MPFTKIDIVKAKVIFFTIFIIVGTLLLHAQPTPRGQPDVSNKTLITSANQDHVMGAAALHKLANDYYNWRNQSDPVSSSNAGLHTWDDKLADFSPDKISERAQHVRALLDKVRAMKIDTWPKDEKIDALLFRSQLEGVDFQNRVLKFERTNPQTYIGECVSAIFSLLKKEYDTPRKRALSATARLKAMPALLKQGLSNLQNPVKLYAKRAIDSARSIGPLLKGSLMALDVDLAPTEHEELIKARDAALAAAHSFADELEKRMPKMVDFAPMGEANYNYYLKHVLLLPLDATQVEMVGRAELARYRALEALLPDPKLADPDPKRASHIPPDQESFLKAYESREEEMLMCTGAYPNNSPAQGQILRLSRYRAARIGVDVNLHTGRWSFEQAVKYFMDAGGLDREAAEGEAAGAASSPTQKISYITGKWQIMNLLGRYKDRQGENFRLGQFHDDLVKNGSLPISVIEWLLLDDPAAIQQATK